MNACRYEQTVHVAVPLVDHAYLGPVLSRCDHEEHEHLSLNDWIDADGDGIFTNNADWHEYTEEAPA